MKGAAVTTERDPIEFELFKNTIFSIADEMAVTIVRTTYSAVLRDNMDFSTGFADAQGRIVAQGVTCPGHLGAMPTTMASIVGRFGNDMRPGDVFIMNDPYEGGMHLPDIFVIKPIYVGDERKAFAVTLCHHTDVGGRVAGSNASDSTEIYQEGLRIPPLKLYEAGERNDTIFSLIEKNVRVPVNVVGDLRGQLSACHVAERQFLELVERHGEATVDDFMTEVVDYAERRTRAAIRQLPDGVFSFEDWIDDDGIDRGSPIRLHVTLTKSDDTISADWTGSAPQVRGAINSTLSFTKSATYCGVRSVLPDDIPNNEGVFRAIDVYAPPGTVTNVVLPGACAARGLTGFRMLDTVMGALAQMVPDRVFAASDGGVTGISIGGYHRDRTPFVYVEFTCSGWGGRPWADGLDANSNLFGNMTVPSVELTEAEQPFQMLAYEFIPDRSGAGKYRGGAAVRRDFRLLADESVLQVRSDRSAVRPYGLYGGQPGKPSLNLLDPDGARERLPGKFNHPFRAGEVFRHQVAGAGGWGDPLDRDPAAVLRDVRNEFVSVNAAREEYGVVVDTDAWSVNESATVRRREEIRNARGWTEVPAMLREESPPPAAA